MRKLSNFISWWSISLGYSKRTFFSELICSGISAKKYVRLVEHKTDILFISAADISLKLNERDFPEFAVN